MTTIVLLVVTLLQIAAMAMYTPPTTTMIMSYPSILPAHEKFASSDIITFCLNTVNPVYGLNSLVLGAPTLSEICWIGGYTTIIDFTAQIGVPISLADIPAAYTTISSECNTGFPFPAYAIADTFTTSSYIVGGNGGLTLIALASQSTASKFMCALSTRTDLVSTCSPIISVPGSAYVVARVETDQAAGAWSALCHNFITDDPYLTGSFAAFSTHPLSYIVVNQLLEGCPQAETSLLLNQDLVPNSLALFTTSVTDPIPFNQASNVQYAICSLAPRPCTTQVSGWFYGSIYPPLPTNSWSSFCEGELSAGFIGTFQTPAPEDLAAVSLLSAFCPFGTTAVYTAGQSNTATSSYTYGLCKYTPLQFTYATNSDTTVTISLSTTITSSIISTTTTTTDSFISFDISTTFLVSSTSITTSTTSTQTIIIPSTTTTSTTTTTTSVRVLSDSTTTTTSTTLTFTESITTRSTGSFTNTIRTTAMTTVTRTITRSQCEPTLTTTTATTLQVDTLTITERDTVYIDVIVTVPVTKASSSSCPLPTLTRTRCSTSTSIVCQTSVHFQRPTSDCPPISAIVCDQGSNNLVMLFNTLPYSQANCPCAALGRTILTLASDADYMDAYATVLKCGGGLGRAWAVVAQDYTRCYVVSADGSVTLAASCDEPLPVLCR